MRFIFAIFVLLACVPEAGSLECCANSNCTVTQPTNEKYCISFVGQRTDKTYDDPDVFRNEDYEEVCLTHDAKTVLNQTENEQGCFYVNSNDHYLMRYYNGTACCCNTADKCNHGPVHKVQPLICYHGNQSNVFTPMACSAADDGCMVTDGIVDMTHHQRRFQCTDYDECIRSIEDVDAKTGCGLRVTHSVENFEKVCCCKSNKCNAPALVRSYLTRTCHENHNNPKGVIPGLPTYCRKDIFGNGGYCSTYVNIYTDNSTKSSISKVILDCDIEWGMYVFPLCTRRNHHGCHNDYDEYSSNLTRRVCCCDTDNCNYPVAIKPLTCLFYNHSTGNITTETCHYGQVCVSYLRHSREVYGTWPKYQGCMKYAQCQNLEVPLGRYTSRNCKVISRPHTTIANHTIRGEVCCCDTYDCNTMDHMIEPSTTFVPTTTTRMLTTTSTTSSKTTTTTTKKPTTTTTTSTSTTTTATAKPPAEHVKKEENGSPVGTVFFILFVLALLGVVGFFVYRYRSAILLKLAAARSYTTFVNE